MSSKIKVDTNIPIFFQKIEERKVKDTRFTKVKIYLMHLGENLNGTYFTKEVVTKAIPSLANTPILGFIEKNSNDDQDFSDHRNFIGKDKDGNWKIQYEGRAFGVIPETNNAKFEERLCDDGITREFLTVEGLLWNKWDDPIDIMNRDVIKSQSMELDPNSIVAEYNAKDNIFYMQAFKFFGACILGIDYNPAMKNASIILQGDNNQYANFSTIIQEKIEQYKQAIKQYKEDSTMEKEKMKILKKYSKTKTEIEEMGINFNEITANDLEEKLKLEQNNNSGDSDKEKSKQNIDKKQNTQTQASNEDKDTSFTGDNSDEKHENKVLDNNSKNSNTDNYQKKYNDLKTQYNELNNKYKELKKYKDEKVKTEKQELFEKYEKLNGIAEFEQLKKDIDKFKNVEDLEKEIALVFTKNYTRINTNNNNNNSFIRFKTNYNTQKDEEYGGLFDKYLDK